MLRNLSLFGIVLLTAPTVNAQSDEEILELVRTNATKVYLEQASWTLPETFHESGLAPSDKDRLIKEWAEASGDCLADALVTYSKTTETPIAEMVSDDGSFVLKGEGLSSEFDLHLTSCLERTWEAIGASLP